MRLKTNHDTYVFAGQAGKLLHGPNPVRLDGRSPPRDALAAARAAGGREIAVTTGPLAPSTMIVLEGDRVAFRRDRLYLCADPTTPELAFNRTEVGPWEQFTIEAMSAGSAGVALPHIPKSYIPPLSGTAADFRRRARAKFAITEEDSISPPTTISAEHLTAFQNGAKVDFPIGLNKRYLSKCSINKLPSKYVTLSDLACGVVFDKQRFLTDPAALRVGTPPAYIFREGDGYRLDFEYLNNLSEETETALIFYDGNYHNYFHWWVECLANIELAYLCMESIPPLVVWNGKPKLSAWQLASLDILGVDVVHRTTKSSGVVRVKEAIWFYRESGHTPSLLLQALRTRALKAISTPYHAGKKIYIKRRTHRSASNDDAVERLLTNLGYETICTEDLLQADQIALFSGAQSVVAIHGAGLANMLFMPPGATVIELTPHVAVRPFYWIMAQKLKHRYGVLMCNAVEGRFDGRIEVNLSDLSRLIAKMDPDAGPSCRPSGDDPGLGGGRP